MKFKFEDLRVWKQAMDLGEEINIMSQNFPKREIYNLSSQILRAVDSVALNLAEGSTGQSNKEFNKFVGYSMRSLAEVATCLHKAKMRKYIDEREFKLNYTNCFHLMNQLAALRKSFKSNS